MIEGLKVIVVGTELVDLCKAQAARLRDKAVLARKNEAVLKEAPVEFSSSNVNQFKDRAAECDSEADELDFTAKHIALGESYLLDSSDLRKLGIVKRAW